MRGGGSDAVERRRGWGWGGFGPGGRGGGRALFKRGGGVQPPPPGGAEVLEVPKKIFGLKWLAPEAPEKIFDRPKARRNIF